MSSGLLPHRRRPRAPGGIGPVERECRWNRRCWARDAPRHSAQRPALPPSLRSRPSARARL